MGPHGWKARQPHTLSVARWQSNARGRMGYGPSTPRGWYEPTARCHDAVHQKGQYRPGRAGGTNTTRLMADTHRLAGIRWEALKPSGQKNHKVGTAVGMKSAPMLNSQ